MKVKIEKSVAKGTVKAPASKSMAHRLLICAGLSIGESKISGVQLSEDILATIDCLKSLGADVSIDGETVTVNGRNPSFADGNEFYCRESGSTMRFFIPLLLLSGKKQTLFGSERLTERPMTVYEDICKAEGLLFHHENGKITVCGKLSNKKFSVAGNISSQFISGLLFALPFIGGDCEINIIPPVESKSYIDLTISSMKAFDVNVTWENENILKLKGGQSYQPKSLSVEGDYSNSSFLDAFNLLGGNVEITELLPQSIQGDRVYREFFNRLDEDMPCFSVKDCPDLAPVLMALGAAKNGIKLKDTARLKIKESDRGTEMAKELIKFGIHCEIGENEITVCKGALHSPVCDLSGHNDHRIVMSMAVLCSVTGGIIDGAQAVKKSYPDFFSVIKKLGVEVSEI